jgi:hypothetical protein
LTWSFLTRAGIDLSSSLLGHPSARFTKHLPIMWFWFTAPNLW